MGRKIFVSYKYGDIQVKDLNIYEKDWFGQNNKVQTKARHYVDELTKIIDNEDHIYKGENDDESMENLKDSSIASKLGDKIFDSSITIVLVSKGMKDSWKQEKDQWIPWEISYSLKRQTREGRSSSTNGVLAIILPDELGSYSYYITQDEECNCRNLNTPFLFQILRDNMFNIKNANRRLCNGYWVYSGHSSYIQSVKWEDFKENPNTFFDKTIELRDKKEEYNIIKTIK